MSRRAALAYAIGCPLLLVALLFLPAGAITWRPGWIFLAVLALALSVAAMVIARVNPVIFSARSRFQLGTKRWDRILVAVILTAMAAILPVSALDAGRFRWSSPPLWLVLAGYIAMLAGVAGTTWAQAVNPFFEPGVRIQSERDQRVIDSGPYRLVRHPGYSCAVLLLAGMPLSLGSLWGLVPAALAAAVMVLRTSWEDQLLRAELPGYRDYAGKVRWRLIPGLW
jgi:protein-S-isoprenylcysteine O-methyltransferase Ste14